ncbi:hypothetical protein LJ739_11060 [Aestuariibacter halophilus]|uniref:DoxX family protein n=1 Tax=Fluctibacter halophilus TaxID=226011 RepID=A0ABS8G885_9ALTE|nr:hypothetical protein [Aestuariibacter halophilus]MCC2616782.1 hypothetical protein [Aestuariibacter halophilus]
MNTSSRMQAPYVLWARRALIAVLAGLLIFYHSNLLYAGYVAGSASQLTMFDHLQLLCRGVIVFSLLAVLPGQRIALTGMWAGITALIATQYWAHFGDLPLEFTHDRHPLSYLRGLIFPALISLAFVGNKKSAEN